jgi:lipopolysaccharide exporter
VLIPRPTQSGATLRIYEIVRFLPRSINFKSELLSSTFSFGATALIRLVSSLILTRVLSPEAYGVFGILVSIVFVIELVSDVGFVGLLVRHPRGGEVKFVHTIWTTRLIRCVFNFSLMFVAAPVVATIYHLPALANAFRVLSFQFLITGLESMSFIVAQREQRARIGNYAELISGIASSVFVIIIAFHLRNYYAFILGVLFQRALLTIGSHFFYRNIGVGIAFDREAIADQFRFARYVMPSSVLTMILSQYDKLVLLRLFNLTLLGVYGLAQNMIAPISGVIVHNARVVLYARCADYFRTNSATARARYYAENKRLLMLGMILPALAAGFANLIVNFLYDARYAMVGPILMILSLGALVGSFQNASENLLVASGRTHTVLVANVVRLFTVIPATLLGYYFFGFYGFVWCNLVAALLVLAYYYIEQRRFGLLRVMNELKLLGAAVLLFALSLGVSHVLLKLIPAGWQHLGIKGH